VALKFVALERDKKVGQIALCDQYAPATHRLKTNWQLHWTQPPRTGFGLPRCKGWPQRDRVFDAEPGLVERSGRLPTSSGLIGVGGFHTTLVVEIRSKCVRINTNEM
jgi:hypothetical protein